MDKTTKYCDLAVRLTDGSTISGRFHVPLRTGSTIRPSDALRETANGFLVLTNACVRQRAEETRHESLLVPLSSVSFVELPSGWTAR